MIALSWLRAGYSAARAKSFEELLRLTVLRRYRADERVAHRIAEVMSLDPAEIGSEVGATDARSIPGSPRFVATGWSEHMLLRYLIALDHCAGASVLDSCSGLGWGSYLIASLSAAVTGVDLDAPSIRFCTQRWQSRNLHFQVASVLNLPFEDESFDVVLCMDAIEHFSLDGGKHYLQELRRVCRPRGRLFGSSAFPETRWGATRLCRTNPNHQHIYTRHELLQVLRSSFGRPDRITRHYFQATRL